MPTTPTTYQTVDALPPVLRDRWLRRTARELSSAIKAKFKLGEAQYQSDFGNQTIDFLLDQIEQEAIDTLMYVREMKRRRMKSNPPQSEL